MGILTDLFLTFARIGAFTFGGGYAMLSLLEHECVEKKGWLTADEMTEVTVMPLRVSCLPGQPCRTGFRPLTIPAGMAII